MIQSYIHEKKSDLKEEDWEEVRLGRSKTGKKSDWEEVRLGRSQTGQKSDWEEVRLGRKVRLERSQT